MLLQNNKEKKIRSNENLGDNNQLFVTLLLCNITNGSNGLDYALFSELLKFKRKVGDITQFNQP
jgi:hypothetical protein